MKSTLLAVLFASLSAATADATVVLGSTSNSLYQIDTDLETTTFLGSIQSSPEIQLVPGGFIHAHRNNGGLFQTLSSTDGSLVESIELDGFPGGTNQITSMEYVNGLLYASVTVGGPESDPTWLVTVDTTTGLLTTIGDMSAMGLPSGGLAWVGATSTMYTVSSTDSGPGVLYTVNLSDGSVSQVAAVTLNGGGVDSLTSLVWDGSTMFTTMQGSSMIYSLDLGDGTLSDVFDPGMTFVSLTAVPEPAHFAGAAALVGLVVALRRRHGRAVAGCAK